MTPTINTDTGRPHAVQYSRTWGHIRNNRVLTQNHALLTTMESTLSRWHERSQNAFSNTQAAGNRSNQATEWPKDSTVVAHVVGVAAFSGILRLRRLNPPVLATLR